MEKTSPGILKRIQNNHKITHKKIHSLVEDCGFHDSISWDVLSCHNNPYNGTNTIYNVYLRDLSLCADLSLNEDKIGHEFKIINCSEDYLRTIERCLCNNKYRRSKGNILHEIGEWTKSLCDTGRLVMEIVSCYDDNSHLRTFQLRHLDNAYCTVKKSHIEYKAPFIDRDKQILKTVKIPINKCILIDFPKERGGYRGFQQKIAQILVLGEKFEYDGSPINSMNKIKSWENKFNHLISDWGNNRVEGCTDYYFQLNQFRFHYTALLCVRQAIKGFEDLIDYLNERLNEDAKVVFNSDRYTSSYFLNIKQQWASGNLTFKAARDFLYNK